MAGRLRLLRTGRRALAVLALAGLAACAAGPREQLGAVLGGAAGGLAGAQVGQGSGRLAATAAGAGLGTLAGSALGRDLDRLADSPTARARTTYHRPPDHDARRYPRYERRRDGRYGPWRAGPVYRQDDWRYARPAYRRDDWRYARPAYRRAGPRLARPVADPTRQVPIPGAHVPGSFWAWLPDLAPPAPMRNVRQVAAPAASADCVRLEEPRLKPAYRCTTDGLSYVLQ